MDIIMRNPLLCKLPDVWSVLLAVFKMMLFICFLLTLFIIYTLDGGAARRKFATLFLFREGLLFINTSTTSSDYYDSELPVCVGNLLDQREYRYVRETGESYDANRLHSVINKGSSACRLLHYTPQRLVSCFDDLHYFVHNKTESGVSRDSKLRFVFLGDSRIRHQFYNFVRLIPDFGSEVWPIEITPAFHADIDITSDILRLGLSFQWRPLINETVVETVRQWATHEDERPYFVFLGMAVHHMMKENGGGSFKSYQENFMKLAPILGQLANVTRVVWLNQYPSVDSNSWINDVNTIIFSEKIHSYNKAIRRILENENIPIWDSSNPLAKECVRACATLKRDEIFDANGRPCLFKDVTYYDCDDFIHTGYSALSQATQLLFNDICNSHVNSTHQSNPLM